MMCVRSISSSFCICRTNLNHLSGSLIRHIRVMYLSISEICRG